MSNSDVNTVPGAGLRPSDVARQLDNAYREPMRQAGRSFEVLVGLGCQTERAGDPFRLREALDVILSGEVQKTGGEPVRISFSGRSDKPLVVEISGATLPAGDRVQALVAQMSGEISGPVPQIRMTFPVMTVEAAAPPAAPALALQKVSGQFDRLRLLIADDSPTNRLVIQEMLADTGAEVTSVGDGQQVVDVWQRQPFDMMLLDIAMPVMDGLSALKTIRAEEEARGLSHVPAIAVTAHAMSHQVAEYIMGGFDTHLSKPFRRRELLDTISALRPQG